VFIVVSGLPGTGKTTVAHVLAQRLRAVHLSIDPVENAMLESGLENGWSVGVAAYEVVRVMAQHNLTLGLPVVVDAVNDSELARDTWRRAAGETGTTVHFVLLNLPSEQEHRRRLQSRKRGLSMISEPTWERVCARAAAYEPWVGPHVVIDASGPLESVVNEVLAAVC